MPPKSGRGRTRAIPRHREMGGRSQDVPDVYQQMLADAASSSPSMFSSENRPLKKRRVGSHFVNTENAEASATSCATPPVEDVSKNDASRVGTESPIMRPAIYKSLDDSDDSDGSDMDWEDVELVPYGELSSPKDEPQNLDLVLGGNDDETKQTRSQRRKAITGAERNTRLEIHKMHVMSLLAHVHLRNYWCNDEIVQVCS